MSFLPVCDPCKTVPRVIPRPHPPSSVGCSTATDTATISPFSTWELQAITPGTYTYSKINEIKEKNEYIVIITSIVYRTIRGNPIKKNQ